MNTRPGRCIKNMQHEWETIVEYATHILKQCTRCNVKHWKAR